MFHGLIRLRNDQRRILVYFWLVTSRVCVCTKSGNDIGVRAIICRGGGKPMPKKFLKVAPFLQNSRTSLQCRRFLRARKCFCSRKPRVETFRREKEMGRVKGSGEGAVFFLPFPFPLSFFRPRTHPKGYYFYSPQSSTVIKSKMAATTIRTRTRFRPAKIRLHDHTAGYSRTETRVIQCNNIGRTGRRKWLETVFQGQYLPSLSINYGAINKHVEKLPPKLYEIKVKICYDQSCHSNKMTPLPIILAALFLTGNSSSKIVHGSFFLQ